MTVSTLLEILTKISVSMICNRKFVLTLSTAFIVLFTSFFNASMAEIKKGGLEYHEDRFDFSALDTKELTYEGNIYFNQALAAQQKTVKKEAFEKALSRYYLVTKANPKDVYAITQIARIHDLKKEDKYAKQYYFRAFNIEPKSPHVNYHFGEFYFKRDKLEKAVIHYIIAYQNGYEKNYNLNCRLAIAYDKLGDLKKAKQYYQIALSINPQQSAIKSRLEKINNLNYENSEYYQGAK